MRYVIHIIMGLLLLTACEKRTPWEMQIVEDSRLVVEGLLTNERKAHEVKLSYTVTSLNKPPQVVSGAVVVVSHADSVVELQEAAVGTGVYVTPPDIQGVVDLDYQLMIIVKGDTFTATAMMVPVSPLEPVKYVYVESSDKYRIEWIHETIEPDPAMYELSLDWSHVPGFDTLSYEENHALLYSYSLGSIDVAQVLSPAKQEIYFPEGTIIIEKKYSLTEAHSDYLRALASETEWRGGFFDVAQANLPTNLSEGAIGFFGASTVIVDTIVVAP